MTVFGVSVVKKVEFVVTRKPLLLEELDRLDRLVEDAVAGDRRVVALAQAVDVDGPREVRRRRERVLVQRSLQQLAFVHR